LVKRGNGDNYPRKAAEPKRYAHSGGKILPMRKAKQPRAVVELSRLRTMPEAVYFEAILILVGRRRVSRVATGAFGRS